MENVTMRARSLLIAALAIPWVLYSGVVHSQTYIKVGILTCRGEQATGIAVGSVQGIRCAFYPSRGNGERYYGTIRRFGGDGGDGGVKQRFELLWTVLAPTPVVDHGDLAGTYVEASTGTTGGFGGDANILAGGSYS
jgi:hypothetical protein